MITAQELERRHPEWAPWLSVLGVTLAEADESHWDAAVPRPDGGDGAEPLIARCPLPADTALVSRWFEKLRRAAIRSEAPKFLGWSDALSSETGALAVFAAALCSDDKRLSELARAVHVEPEAFAAIAALLPVPFLQACRRAWTTSTNRAWDERYCPCCGAWPVSVEVCGIERSRYLRCARCASNWRSECLRCVFCGNADHERLRSLLAEAGKDVPALELCEQCKGYIKVFNRLAPSQPAEVLLSDLASVDFDVAAANRGYQRPSGLGWRFEGATDP
jgi:FdhE protein